MDRSKTIKASPFLGLAIGILGSACGSSSLATPQQTVANDQTPPPTTAANDNIGSMRALGPAGLDIVLARYDATPEGPEREALALTVDRVAGQRYATASRLFWYTDIDEARAAARESKKPILSLRMLGRLDEDLSCANSRLFRVVLYANAEVSALLRESFILHWSSERVVPRVTIDYGDGRTIETTIAGNSAHYVLDWDGRPVDVLPGLYSPERFVRALRGSIATAVETATMNPLGRAAALTSYHTAVQRASEADFASARVALRQRIPQPGTTTIGAAEQLTITKAAMEQPMVRVVKLGLPLLEAAGSENLAWELASRVKKPARLDAGSRALLAALRPTDWSERPKALAGAELDQLVKALEFQVTADTVIGELGIRYQINSWFATGQPQSFEALNKRIYSELFRTPASDPWLGIATPGVFTGLPADGTGRQGS